MTEPTPEITYDYKPYTLDVEVDTLFIRSEMSSASHSQKLGKFSRGRATVLADFSKTQSIGEYYWMPILHKDKPAFVALHSENPDKSIKDLYAIPGYIQSPEPVPEPPVEPPTPDPDPEPPIPNPEPPALPFDEIAIEAIVNRVIDLRLENLRSHIDEGHIPRTLAITISRAMRVIAGMLDAAIALEETPPQPTTTQVAAAVYDKNNDVEAAMLVKSLIDPPK